MLNGIDHITAPSGLAFAIFVFFVILFLFLLLHRRSKTPTTDSFRTLAARAGGKVVAERLVAGELRNGAKTRREAIERAIYRLESDRRSWR